MTKEQKELVFEFTSPINWENSFTSKQLSDSTKSIMTIDINKLGNGFVVWEVPELNLQEEIELIFDNNTLIDYSGVFELPKELTDKLIELGYNVDEVI